MLHVYGITNCSTVKKARAWLEANQLDYTFHDCKKEGVPENLLDGWLKQLGWEPLVNRRGPTWHKLAPDVQASVTDNASAKTVMLANSSVIKRPLVMKGKKVIALGFDEAGWTQTLL